MNFNPAGFDPSKMDPKVLMELSRLVQQLPPDQMNRMQTLMHNMMAGFDVHQEMEEFERSLPAGFREKLVQAMGGAAGFAANTAVFSNPLVSGADSSTGMPTGMPKNEREARLTLLRAVADQKLAPEEAHQLLFPGE